MARLAPKYARYFNSMVKRYGSREYAADLTVALMSEDQVDELIVRRFIDWQIKEAEQLLNEESNPTPTASERRESVIEYIEEI